MLWMLFRRPGEPSAEKVQQLLTYCLHIGGLGAPYWSLRGSHGSLRGGFCLRLGTRGHQKETQGVVVGPSENCNIGSLGAPGWHHMDTYECHLDTHGVHWSSYGPHRGYSGPAG